MQSFQINMAFYCIQYFLLYFQSSLMEVRGDSVITYFGVNNSSKVSHGPVLVLVAIETNNLESEESDVDRPQQNPKVLIYP